MFARISDKLGFRHCGLVMFLGIETVKGAGCISLMAILMSSPSNSATDDVGDEAVDEVLIESGAGWVPDFRVIITLRQNCL